jgi:chorismate mutase
MLFEVKQLLQLFLFLERLTEVKKIGVSKHKNTSNILVHIRSEIGFVGI